MEIILLKDIETLGNKHEVVKVKNGYGRNFLIPKGLAVIANDTNRQKLNEIIEREKAEEEQRLEEYMGIKEKLDGNSLKIGVKSGTSGKIFGSVTAIQIINALKDQYEVEIPREKIDLEEEMKELGKYKTTIQLHPEVVAVMDLELIPE